MGQSSLQRERFDDAERYVQEAISLLGKSAPNVYSMLESYATMGGLYLTLAELKRQKSEAYLTSAEAGCRILRGFARLYPVGRPRSLILQGRLSALRGDREKSNQSYQQGLEAARAFGMTYEQKLAEQMLMSTQ